MLRGRAFSGQPAYVPSSAGQSACGGWDLDCSGAEERLHTVVSSCRVGSGSVPMCILERAGWNTTEPACGGSGNFVTNCFGAGSCTGTQAPHDQECR